MANTPPSGFITLSSILTGFTTQTLILAHQSADFYGEFVKVYSGYHVAQLLKTFQQLETMGKKPDEIATLILNGSISKEISEQAKALMTFWYTGQIDVSKNPAKSEWVIPSSTIYAEGLAWRAIQAHPTGVSKQKFG
ncbi:MAG: hypothetical protein WBD01_07415 [Salaquimonas sp.]